MIESSLFGTITIPSQYLQKPLEFLGTFQPYERMQKSIKDYLRHTRSVPYVLVDISVLEKGMHNAELVAITKLQ